MALLIDGVAGSKIQVGESAKFKLLGNLTWSGWIRIAAHGASDVVVCLEVDTGEDEDSNANFYIDMQGASGATDLRWIHEFGAGSNESQLWDTNLALDTWYPTVFRRNTAASTLDCFVNGVQVSTRVYTNSPTSTATVQRYLFGGRAGATSNTANMAIAEAGLWNVALSDGACTALSLGRLSPLAYPTGLISYVPGYRTHQDYLEQFTTGSSATGVTVFDHPRAGRRTNTSFLYLPSAGGAFMVLQPDGDAVAGSWTTNSGATTNLYAAIDESSADNSDYVRSEANPSSSLVEFTLSNPGYGVGVGAGAINVNYQRSTSDPIFLIVRLKQGATTISSTNFADVSTTVFQASVVITTAEVSTITDTNNLRLQFEARASSP